MNTKLWIFVVITVLFLVFTLSRHHNYRFYRFFAFESIICLIILNTNFWFTEPFTLIHIISWTFLAISLLLAIHCFILLKVAGFPKGNIEDTTELATKGAFRYIRHPLYCTLIIGGMGAFLKYPTVVGILILLTLFVFTYATAKVEEKDNLKKFGSAYQIYMDNTKMFFPYIF
ncbi:methyltransferase family protein [Bacteroidota bacterium]